MPGQEHGYTDTERDMFYTRYRDIEREINAYNPAMFHGMTVLCPCDDCEWGGYLRFFAASFQRLGLHRLIGVGYPKQSLHPWPTRMEALSPAYDPQKDATHARLFILDHSMVPDGHAGVDDIRFIRYLGGGGDYHSPEVTALRDASDIIVTTPPYRRWADFLTWALEDGKHIILLGNMNAVTYNTVFPLLKAGKLWLGAKPTSRQMWFHIPGDYRKWLATHRPHDPTWRENGDGEILTTIPSLWYTNLPHRDTRRPLRLDTMDNNLKYNRKLRKRLLKVSGQADRYPKYDNYNAIEVPYVECIPGDYGGVMGVPITFMDRWDPKQWELLAVTGHVSGLDSGTLEKIGFDPKAGAPGGAPLIRGRSMYSRILIRRRLEGDAH